MILNKLPDVETHYNDTKGNILDRDGRILNPRLEYPDELKSRDYIPIYGLFKYLTRNTNTKSKLSENQRLNIMTLLLYQSVISSGLLLSGACLLEKILQK